MQFHPNGHTGHATLVQVIDREADAQQIAAVNLHLESCPDCRVRMAALQGTMHEFDIALSGRLDFLYARAEGARARLQAQLRVMGAKQNRSSWKRFPRIHVPVMRLSYLTGTAAAMALAAVFLSSMFAPARSKKEFLVRATAAQSVHGPTNRLLRIRLQGKDFKRKSEERRGRSIFAKARLDWDDPLSSTAFARWHDSVPEKNDEVTRSQGRLTLRTTTKADRVKEASYTVEGNTRLPVSETIMLRDGTNVEITTLPNPSASQVNTLGQHFLKNEGNNKDK